ncbi:MAG: WYL domain-containing protein [Lachnospiraceae bacterium]|nr:WYL domain-containing protein [Lachnospiraceae bacterium]
MNKFEPYMESVSDDPNKQHINLSEQAWEVIEFDRTAFSVTEEALSLSGFLNTIFENYLISIEDETEIRLPLPLFQKEFDREVEWIRQALGRKRLSEEIIDGLRREYVVRNQKCYGILSRGEGRKFRLNNAVLNALSSMQGSMVEEIFDKPGKYLSAFYEEYARMSFYDREELYFHAIISGLQDWINRQRSGEVYIAGKRFLVIPFCISGDRGQNYHYLAGMSKANEEQNYKPASFRISRISSIGLLTADAKRERKMMEKEFDSALKSKGIQFLLNDTARIRIRLDDIGKKMFNQQLHLRPVPEKRNGNVFEFVCTQMQAEYYFFKFGHHAEVLSPVSLRNLFSEKYQEAAGHYS